MRALPGKASRLPPGPQPVTRTAAAADQRRRIIRATVDLVAKRGYHATTIELIVRRARVGYATFYKNFADKEECFLAMFDETADRVSTIVVDALEEEGADWPRRVAGVLGTLFDLIASDPALARACLVESLTAGPTVVAHYEKSLRKFGTIFRPGRRFVTRGVTLPDTLEDTLAGGVLWVAYQRLIVGEADALRALLPETLEFVLSPYLGEDEAVRVVSASMAQST